MKQDNRHLAEIWLAQLDERLAWLDQAVQDMPVDECVAISAALNDRRTLLGVLIKEMENRSAEHMKKAGIKKSIVAGLDGSMLTVEQTNRPTRSEVKRDDLIRDIERLALRADVRTDPITGEMKEISEMTIDLLKRCFRFEPRWTDIAKVGLTIDEYSQTVWSQSIKVAKAETL
jgi:hypothetical protein